MTKALIKEHNNCSPLSNNSLSTSRDSETTSTEPSENNYIIESQFRNYLYKLFKDLAKRSTEHPDTAMDANTFIAYSRLSGLIGERFWAVARGKSSTINVERFTEIMINAFSQNAQI